MKNGFLPVHERLSADQKEVLRLSYERLVAKDDLPFSEILISLFHCKPQKIGSHPVENLSLSQILDVCRLEPQEDFQFSDRAEKERCIMAQNSAYKAIVDLIRKGLVLTIKSEKLIWAEDKARVERIEYYQMIRLTEKGRKTAEEIEGRKVGLCALWPILFHWTGWIEPLNFFSR